MPFFDTADRTSLFYNDWGTGKPVVFIHGWPLSSAMWEYQIPPLASQGFRCIAYDRRGFGKSSQPWTGYDYDTLSADLATLLDKLDLREVTLVGFSMGGGEIARYLSRHGTGRIARAALISAVTPFLLKTADNPDGVDRSTFDAVIDSIQRDRPTFMASFGREFYGAGLLNYDVTDELLAWSHSLAMQASPQATLDCVHAFSETDFRADMPAFTIPTLIIHGDADATVPIDAGRAAAGLIPQAVFVEYGGAPHGLFFTEKDRLNADLLAFLTDSALAPPPPIGPALLV